MCTLQDQAVPNNESHQQDVLVLSASRVADTHHVSSLLVVLDFCGVLLSPTRLTCQSIARWLVMVTSVRAMLVLH